MKRADFASMPSAVPCDEATGSEIHKLDADKDGITYFHRVNQEEQRSRTPEHKRRDADAGGASFADHVDNLRGVPDDHETGPHNA